MIVLALVSALLAVATPPDAIMQWNAQIESSGSVSFMTIYREQSSRGSSQMEEGRSYPASSLGTEFRGLTLQQLRTPGTAVRFEVVRQEGTLACTGTVAAAGASGTFTYNLDPAFASTLERRGAGRPTERMQLEWLLGGVDIYGLLDAAAAASFPTPSAATLKTAVDHGVSAEFLRSLAAAGMRPDSMGQAIAAVDHGVSPRFVAAMQTYGFRQLTIAQAIQLVDHGVSAHYVQGLAKLGYHVTPDQAVRMVDHGVSIAYIERMRAKGYTNLSVDDLVRLVDHGVQ